MVLDYNNVPVLCNCAGDKHSSKIYSPRYFNNGGAEC